MNDCSPYHLPSPKFPQQGRKEVQRELWRIQDVLAGLSGRRENYRFTVDWLHNPGGSFVIQPFVHPSQGLMTEPPHCPQRGCWCCLAPPPWYQLAPPSAERCPPHRSG